MATVYERRADGTYVSRNEYELDDYTVAQAVDALCGDDCRVSSSDIIMGYGESVLIERENEDGEYEPYIIIGE